MAIKVEIPGYLQQYANNNEKVDVEGKTVKECLLNLGGRYPAMMPELFYNNGEVSVIILHDTVPVGDESINRPVKDGDNLVLFPIIEGG